MASLRTHPSPGRRARRVDAGLVRCTARDLQLLELVGEQYALTLPQLALVMGGRSLSAARWLRDRWQQAGWVTGRALVVGEPVMVWLTRRGQTLTGSPYALWRANPGRVAHISAVTDVRLHVLDRHPGAGWVCERELAQQLGASPATRGLHRPDGLVVVDGGEVAVEVELSLKERGRAEQIMRELVARYASVTYFSARAPRRLLERLAADVGGGRVQVLPIPDPKEFS